MRLGAFGVGRSGFASLFGLLLLVPGAVGCGSRHGKVSGRVLQANGAPLTGGRVTFRPEDPKKNSITAELDEQGNYEVELPTGQVKVSIDNRHLEPRTPRVGNNLPSGMPLSPEVKKKLDSVKPDPSQTRSGETDLKKAPGQYVRIPKKFYDTETSGLEFTVDGGDQKHDIEMPK